jgi:holin-like protein
LNLLVPLATLLICQLAGETLVRLTGLPLPGPVVGLVLLFIGLSVRGGMPENLSRVANGLLAHLSLLFVPAGVGVILHLSRIQAEWPAILVALVVSTWVALAVGVGTMRLVDRLIGGTEEPGDGDESGSSQAQP